MSRKRKNESPRSKLRGIKSLGWALSSKQASGNSTLFPIKEPIIILGVFILFKIIQTGYALAVNEHPSYLPYIRLAETFVFATISYMAIKRNVAALWTMGVILLLQVFTVVWAVFLVPQDQITFKLFAIVLSAYFVFGGTVLVQLAKAKNGKQDKTNNIGITRPLDTDQV